MPDEPIALRDEILLDVRRSLADPDDSETVFSTPLGDLYQHPPALVDPTALRDVLVDFLDEHQERLFHLFTLREQLFRHLRQELSRVGLVQKRRDIEDDRDVLSQGEFRDFFGVLDADPQVTLLVGTDVEDLVLLFQSVVLPVDIDGQEAVPPIQYLLGDDARGVRFPRPRLSGYEPTPREQIDDG